MFTCDDYMRHRCTHREFYRQFVTPAIIAGVKWLIGEDRLLDSVDPHFNDIPLRRWDKLGDVLMSTLSPTRDHLLGVARATGENLSRATVVCILKEAARQWLELQYPLHAHYLDFVQQGLIPRPTAPIRTRRKAGR